MKRLLSYSFFCLLITVASVWLPTGVLAQSESHAVDVGATVSATCGNSTIEVGEECDDGNTVTGDGCSATCQSQTSNRGGGFFPVLGCTDSAAINYNPAATQDNGSCTYNTEQVLGCTDVSASNYNPNATQNDGSCTYPISGCTNPQADNYNPSATVNDGSCQVRGCIDLNALNYNPAATVNDGSCTYPARPILGCTNPTATNFNATATVNDGSCRYLPGVIRGCTDPTALNYDPLARIDDGRCAYQTPPRPPGPTDFLRLGLGNVQVWGARGTVPLSFVNGAVTDLMGDQMTLIINEVFLAPYTIQSFQLLLDGQAYPFVRNALTGQYAAVIAVPAVGDYGAAIDIRYEGNRVDVLPFILHSAPYGVVFDALTNLPIDTATIVLFQNNLEWPAVSYAQVNPTVTGPNGAYGFIVPVGSYQLVVAQTSYRPYSVAVTIGPAAQVVNQSVSLIPNLPPLLDVIEPGAPLVQNIQHIADRIEDEIKVRSLMAKDWLDQFANDPKVEKITKEIVAPAVLGAAAAILVPSLASIIWPLLRLLFLQPILLLGKRKRESWGMVYNSLTKLPIDLAMVRLIDATANRVIQSRVTDRAGRYLFLAQPGAYTIEVQKGDFVFPSKLLADIRTDGRMVDIYHGEMVRVSEDGVAITPNIPIDPVGAVKTPRRIILERSLRTVQHMVSLSGILVTVGSLYVAPVWYVWLFLAIHIGLYLLFVLYVRPRKPKGWGIVYDRTSKRPIGRAIVRLFTKDYNKLVATQVTDRKGKYAFLVGPNQFYVTYEKSGYKPYQTDPIDATKANRGVVITKDVGLEKKSDSAE